ncbi:MAG: nuclear transport factor 2 family protein [Dehalococcoidia bacterium]
MFGWLAGVILRRSIARVNAGDVGPMLSGYAEDAVLVFPGENSWGGEHRGRAAIKTFLERFVRVGLQFEAHEVMVSGWPWRATMCVVFSDHAKDAKGAIVYENHGVIYCKTRWGKITFQEDFEDTDRVAAFDKWLAIHEPEAVPA